ncbi:hypothetical protein [Bacillus sp. V2I10]|uniref:hypothetical protein n=1 Tax=Bacillus sp. V2I10 TaxID=3042276 RepID=UPI0027860F22|nr:hypothetical protein [Bacillus sp. V2I10]MDQ0860634.1 acyl-CoA reductase-like NAD-dependent aldehyde dehydrogenase [Bacillus sp. V2I10]
MQQHKLYINGEYINSTSEETIDVVNPATEKVISSIFTRLKRMQTAPFMRPMKRKKNGRRFPLLSEAK